MTEVSMSYYGIAPEASVPIILQPDVARIR